MTKKYELTNETKKFKGRTLYRIKALKDFSNVNKGDLGGFVQSEENLSQEGDCWIYDEAVVCDKAVVLDNATVCDNAEILDYGIVRNNGIVADHGIVCHKGSVKDNGTVLNNSIICDNGVVCENGRIRDRSVVLHNGIVCGNGIILGNARICDNAVVKGKGVVRDEAEIAGDAVIKDMKDYLCFRNNWSSKRSFTWTKSNNMWCAGCFYGTGEELIKKAYKESEKSGKMYEKYVKFVENNFVE